MPQESLEEEGIFMAEEKVTIFYNHQYYYSWDKVMNADDRGLQFGDGCYEWIRVHKGHPFALSYHVDRLYRSMRLLGIRAVIAPDEFTEINEIVAEENQIHEGYLIMVVTRGAGPHDFTVPGRMALKPNTLVYARNLDMADIEKAQQGVSCLTMEDTRWPHCDILSLNMLPNIMDRAKALKKKCYDAIYVRNGLVQEATHSNLFIVKEGVVWTTAPSEYMLKGITRSLIMDRVAPTAGVTVIEPDAPQQLITPERLASAEEVFLTNSAAGVIPVLQINGKPVADGKIGKVTANLQKHYLHLLEDGLP